MNDIYGNPVTAASDNSVDAINRFTTSLIGYGTDFAAVFDASDENPDCAMVAALAGQLGLFIETADRLMIADKYLNRAATNAARSTEREQWFIEALIAARSGNLDQALICYRKLAEKYPRDLLAAKLGQTIYFNLGDDDGMLWLADQVIDAHQETAYAHGMRAFGLEQMSRLAEAEEEARRATEIQICEPWAHHAAAHVMITQGRLDDGIGWMRSHSDQWSGCNSFMYTHNWWHLALFHLEKEEFTEALSLYDGFVWGRDKEYSQDQINGISLLWRLELAGVNVGVRWADVAEHVANRVFVNDQPFLDMQYAFALARGKKEDALETLLQGMAQVAENGPIKTREAWRNVAVPAAQAFVAFAAENYSRALDLLRPARAQLQSVGGSHAQRDLFEQVWLHSLLRGGHHSDALELVKQRIAFRRPVPQEQSLLKHVERLVLA